MNINNTKRKKRRPNLSYPLQVTHIMIKEETCPLHERYAISYEL